MHLSRFAILFAAFPLVTYAQEKPRTDRELLCVRIAESTPDLAKRRNNNESMESAIDAEVERRLKPDSPPKVRQFWKVALGATAPIVWAFPAVNDDDLTMLNLLRCLRPPASGNTKQQFSNLSICVTQHPARSTELHACFVNAMK